MTAERYKVTRQQIGSQEFVADQLGLRRLTILKRENGQSPIKLEHVIALQTLADQARQT